MLERDVICWNVKISGLVIHGKGFRALRLVSEMETAIQLDDVLSLMFLPIVVMLVVVQPMCDECNIIPKTGLYI